jgi:RNA polymerase sigma-70 factor (ECF subfamily)
MTVSLTRQDELYQVTVIDYGAALARLARGYEPDPQKCEDLLQEIHLALWLSLRSFNNRCSIRTWAYRVAHNTAVSHVTRRRGKAPRLVSLDELAEEPATPPQAVEDLGIVRRRLLDLVQALAATDRQVILLYLEDVDAASIAEIVGLSPGNVATKIHRIKKVLARRFHAGVHHDA